METPRPNRFHLAGGDRWQFVSQLAIFGYVLKIGWLGIPWMIGWLILGINALNLLDGVDGLASLMGIIIAVAIGVIAAGQGRSEVMLLAFVLAGALGGFLVHNLPPAKIYLGDAGRHGDRIYVGLARPAGVARSPVALNCSGDRGDDAPVRPLVGRRAGDRRRVLKGTGLAVADRSHIHHQLLKRGLNNWQVLGVLEAMACWPLPWHGGQV